MLAVTEIKQQCAIFLEDDIDNIDITWLYSALSYFALKQQYGGYECTIFYPNSYWFRLFDLSPFDTARIYMHSNYEHYEERFSAFDKKLRINGSHSRDEIKDRLALDQPVSYRVQSYYNSVIQTRIRDREFYTNTRNRGVNALLLFNELSDEDALRACEERLKLSFNISSFAVREPRFKSLLGFEWLLTTTALKLVEEILQARLCIGHYSPYTLLSIALNVPTLLLCNDDLQCKISEIQWPHVFHLSHTEGVFGSDFDKKIDAAVHFYEYLSI